MSIISEISEDYSSSESSGSEKLSGLPEGGGGLDGSEGSGSGCEDVEIDITSLVVVGESGTCFSSALEPALVQVFVTVTISGSSCPNSYVRASFAGKSLGSQAGGFNGNGAYYFNTKLHAYPCQEFGLVACLGTSNSISNPDCDGLLCCKLVYIKMPPVCGESCP